MTTTEHRHATDTTSFWTTLLDEPFEQRWVDAAGVRTRVLSAGRHQDRVLIFLHGTGGHAEAFIRNLGPHARHFRSHAIDMIGHGWTDPPADGGFEIDDYVRHLVAFMDAESIQSASLSGESLGGWVAARFALLHPDRLDRLVLNTAGGRTFDSAVMARIRDLSLRAVRGASRETVRTRLEWLMADPSRVTEELVSTRLAIYLRPGFADTMEQLLCLQEPDVRRRNLLSDADLARIAAPTLVVWTSHDPTGAIEVGEEFARLIPDARLVVMDGCGHWPQFEAADEFNRLHLDFLTA
ncbi:MAG: 2-hydroxy-6-ketonona-2,4-dienedioic acid hydrolase [Pseudonocardia sp. SCN 72-86]|nr:MAG: 2-hydroxy-6-ketonona-2,4-dienedioic acid hydrolase [Pseudonocardia sp. SCN 72-86]